MVTTARDLHHFIHDLLEGTGLLSEGHWWVFIYRILKLQEGNNSLEICYGVDFKIFIKWKNPTEIKSIWV